MKYKSHAFTLIEVLITLTLFSMIMVVLLGGIYAGLKAWGKADRHLARSVALNTALQTFAWDAGHLYFATELQDPVFLANQDKSRQTMMQLVIEDDRPGSALMGTVRICTWTLGSDKQRGISWVREEQPILGKINLGAPESSVVLEDVKSVSYRFLAAGEWAEKWEDAKKLPEAIEVSVELAGLPPSRARVTVPLAVGVPE